MHIHFMGIGGSGVSGLAVAAKSMGYEVTGCDAKESSFFKMVCDSGIKCWKGHSAEHIENVDILVRSSAVSTENPEVKAAEEKGIKIVTRGEFLVFLLKDKYKIGVGGSHGKTSTTWMIYRILKAAGLNPSVYAGGKSGGITNIAEGEPYIVELDESDGSIFKMNAESLVITNLEFEHADFYKTPDEMLKSFERYLLVNRPKNLIIGRGFDLSDKLFQMFTPLSFPSKEEIRGRSGFENSDCCNFYIKDDGLYFLFGNREIFVGFCGEPVHILQNRSAALIAAAEYLMPLGLSLPEISSDFWKNIPKVDRRFQIVGNYHGITLVDDYAHHPSEVRALIEQAEFEFSNFCLIFQPHRISRFTAFYSEFKKVLEEVECLIILPVYTAGESCGGISSKQLYEDLKSDDKFVFYAENIEQAADIIVKNEKKLHVSAFVSVGAGDVNKIFAKLLN